MINRAAAIAVLISTALAGCSTSSAAPDHADGRSASLWSNRTAYVGDNAKVAALVNKAGFADLGVYTIALQTDHVPYGLTVAFGKLDEQLANADVSSYATVLLGLVTNLDHVAVSSGARGYSLTAALATKSLGYDVKDLGRDKNRLSAYLKKHGIATG